MIVASSPQRRQIAVISGHTRDDGVAQVHFPDAGVAQFRQQDHKNLSIYIDVLYSSDQQALHRARAVRGSREDVVSFYQPDRLRFGSFLAPFHGVRDDPTLCLERDMQLVEHLDGLGFDEIWVGEHHSAGYEIVSSPEMFIAGVAGRTRNIRFGTGVNSLCYHHPLMLADRLVQLDHQTRGRLICGFGPGQLPSDAAMMGINPADQRRMMNESLECIIDLLDGKTVNCETDWFKLRDARLQLLPYQAPRMEMSVACAITPTGPVTAGRLGLGMLSLASASSIGFDALGQHWEVHEAAAKDNGRPASRDRWRVVVNMHVAETREQARRDLEWGIMDLLDYIRGVTGHHTDEMLVGADTPEKAVDLLATKGIGIFGIIQAGTPDDIIAYIESLQRQSGGFGCVMFLAHNCANFEAVKKSYELFARYVIPHFRGSNRGRRASLDWTHGNSDKTWGQTIGAMQTAIASGGLHSAS
jgi:limonene 1,2-monooxygenase